MLCGVCASCGVRVQYRWSQLCTEVAQNSRRRRHNQDVNGTHSYTSIEVEFETYDVHYLFR